MLMLRSSNDSELSLIRLESLMIRVTVGNELIRQGNGQTQSFAPPEMLMEGGINSEAGVWFTFLESHYLSQASCSNSFQIVTVQLWQSVAASTVRSDFKRCTSRELDLQETAWMFDGASSN